MVPDSEIMDHALAIVFNETPVIELAETVITEMAKIDKGISFNFKSSPKS